MTHTLAIHAFIMAGGMDKTKAQQYKIYSRKHTLLRLLLVCSAELDEQTPATRGACVAKPGRRTDCGTRGFLGAALLSACGISSGNTCNFSNETARQPRARTIANFVAFGF